MNLFPEKIYLNGMKYSAKTLTGSLPENTAPPVPQDVLDFLSEWYNPKTFITVMTSGSTGIPKQISLDKKFVAQSAGRTLDFFQLKEMDRVLLCLPVKYIAGKLMIIRAMLGRLDLWQVDPGSDFSFLGEKTHRPFRFAAMVPNQVSKLLERPELFAGIDSLLIGGSGLPETIEQKLMNVSSSCYASYGMTETATHIALRRINGKYTSKWFNCLKGIKVGLTKNGCLEIEMPGLSRQPLVTNDIAELNDSKNFKVLGRADNVIISGGIKYFPEQIEKKLEPGINHPFFITAQPDERLGSRIVIFIEAEENKELKKNIEALLTNCLDRYERPGEIFFRKKFKRTKTGKTIRDFQEKTKIQS